MVSFLPSCSSKPSEVGLIGYNYVVINEIKRNGQSKIAPSGERCIAKLGRGLVQLLVLVHQVVVDFRVGGTKVVDIRLVSARSRQFDVRTSTKGRNIWNAFFLEQIVRSHTSVLIGGTNHRHVYRVAHCARSESPAETAFPDRNWSVLLSPPSRAPSALTSPFPVKVVTLSYLTRFQLLGDVKTQRRR